MRFWLMILAMLSLALLPGPAHALAQDHPLVGHTLLGHAHQAHAHHHHHDASAESATSGHHHDCPGHHGCVCDAACCAPMCSLYAPPTLAVTRIGHAQTALWPTSDRPRPDAERSPSLRPPRRA